MTLAIGSLDFTTDTQLVAGVAISISTQQSDLTEVYRTLLRYGSQSELDHLLHSDASRGIGGERLGVDHLISGQIL